MAETFRTEEELLALLPVGGKRAISAQDLRDLLYSLIRKIYWDTTEPTGTPDHQEGRTYYNNGTLNVMRAIEGVEANLPEEIQTILSRNATGSQLDNATAVYVDGVIGQKPLFERASKSDISSSKLLALTTHNIPNNSDGYATTFGVVRDYNTTGALVAESWSDGDELFLGEAGALTNVRPSGGDAVVLVGFVLYAHADNGSIFVSIHHIPPIYLEVLTAEARPLTRSLSWQDMSVWAWTDLRVPGLEADRNRDQLTLEPYGSTELQMAFMERNKTSILSLSYQLPHLWCGTAVELHGHLIPMAASDGSVSIEGRYFAGGIGDVLPVTTVGWTSFTKSVPLVVADQYKKVYADFATLQPRATPGFSDFFSVVLKRVADTYVGDNPVGTAAANVCLEDIDIHAQMYLLGSEFEATGENIEINPSRIWGSPSNIPGRGYVYVRLLVKSVGGNAVSFRIYDVTADEVVKLVNDNDAQVTGLTNTTYEWVEIGPLVLASATHEYRAQAKCDSVLDEPRLAQARIAAR